MRHLDRFINNIQYSFLEVAVYDCEDVNDLSKYKFEKNVMMDLCYLKYLPFFQNIERLILKSGTIPSNSKVYLSSLKTLKALILDYEETDIGSEYCLDISDCPNLEYLFARSSYNFCGMERAKSLKTLVVGCWYQSDLSPIKNTNLDTLCINSGKLTSLKGIENVPLLILSLSNQRKLTDISEITHLPLKMLEIESCNKIRNICELSSNSIEYLMIVGRNSVADVSFLSNFNRIRRLSFDVQIENGDLAVLDELEHVILYTDKRHFNRKNAKLPKSSKHYIISEIPEWRYIYNNRFI